MKNILLLGVGGGSVIQTLFENFNFNGHIKGIELDPVIVDIAYKYFNLHKYQNLDIETTDAYSFVLNNTNRFDLIIIDLFQDINTPDFIYQSDFIVQLQNSITKDSYLLLNTICHNDAAKKKLSHFLKHFNRNTFEIKPILQLDQHNRVLIIQKTK